MSSNPYESPATPPVAAPPLVPGAQSPWPYRPASTIVAWLTGLFWTIIVLLALMLATEVLAVTVMSDVIEQFNASGEVAELSPSVIGYFAAMGCVGFMTLPIYIAIVVLYCVWINRANKNARSLGAQDMKISPGWSVGWFFIPFANLWMPYKAVREIYLASRPGVKGTQWMHQGAPAILGWWWAFWLLSNFSGNAELRMSMSEYSEVNQMAVWFGIVNSVSSIAAAYLCLRIVRSIHARQEETAAQLKAPLEAAWT